MKTKQLLTQDLKTGNITLMSNVTSVTAIATKIARLEDSADNSQDNPAAIHVDFEVKQPSHLPAVLEGTKDLGLILQLEDAVEIGLHLIAMGMEHKTADEVRALLARLSQLIDADLPQLTFAGHLGAKSSVGEGLSALS